MHQHYSDVYSCCIIYQYSTIAILFCSIPVDSFCHNILIHSPLEHFCPTPLDLGFFEYSWPSFCTDIHFHFRWINDFEWNGLIPCQMYVWKTCQMMFRSGYTILYSHQQPAKMSASFLPRTWMTSPFNVICSIRHTVVVIVCMGTHQVINNADILWDWVFDDMSIKFSHRYLLIEL